MHWLRDLVMDGCLMLWIFYMFHFAALKAAMRRYAARGGTDGPDVCSSGSDRCSGVWPLADGARFAWLAACAAVAEGSGCVLLPTDIHSADSVSAVLADAQGRLTRQGGRTGLPRSLGSVYGACVARFLHGGLRGSEHTRLSFGDIGARYNGLAVISKHGLDARLLVSDADSDRLLEVCANNTRQICSQPCDVVRPAQVCVAPDGFVFVADAYKDRICVLTPELAYHGSLGDRWFSDLANPTGVCADNELVVVAHERLDSPCVSVFRRDSRAEVRRFHRGLHGTQTSVCLVPGHRDIAVGNYGAGGRVSVFHLTGKWKYDVGEGLLREPEAVACSAFGELVVGDACGHIYIFCARGGGGGVLRDFEVGACTAIALRGNELWFVDYDRDEEGYRCRVFM
jgi:hypothetical protein